MKKIAFFDVDGTLTSEIDGSIPQSAIDAIREARAAGNLMFINTGRCFQHIEPRFREIGFDGYICGCGTNIYCDDKELLHIAQTHETMMEILHQARKTGIDIVFESRKEIAFDRPQQLKNPEAINLYEDFTARGYVMPTDLEAPDFSSDKFAVWYENRPQLEAFLSVSDRYFECIERGGNFCEFVPHGYSKATGIEYILDYYQLDKTDAYAFGDSSNDLAMLTYVPNSIAMGNSYPESLLTLVSYVTKNASADGIALALRHFGFIA